MRIILACSSVVTAGLAAAAPAAAQAVAESNMPQSSVSVLVEPRLNDGRLVIRLAAKNLGKSPVPFGPASVGIARPNGQPVAVTPLAKLVEDVRLAAGMQPSPAAPNPAPTQGAYASPQMTARDGGQLDVTGFTGGSTVGRDEYVRRSNPRKSKPTISASEAEAQIAALNQAILKDSALGPGQIAAGQVVTEPLKLGKKDDRTLHVRVTIGGDQHAFTIAAPQE